MGEEHHAKHSKESGTIEISKSTLWMIISGVLFVMLVTSVFTSGFGIVSKNSVVQGVAAPSPQPNQAPLPDAGFGGGVIAVDAKELVDDDVFIGNENAKVVVIEFSDFQCPFCKRFRDQTFDSIKKEYIDSGKVKFVYRDFPLDSIHPNARGAAIAAECADEQEKFWEYHDLLFEKQAEWAGVGGSLFKQYANELGLDSGKFNNCIDSNKYDDEVNKDLADGSQAGITGTPGFIINGQLLSGAQPFASFKAAIDAEL